MKNSLQGSTMWPAGRGLTKTDCLERPLREGAFSVILILPGAKRSWILNQREHPSRAGVGWPTTPICWDCAKPDWSQQTWPAAPGWGWGAVWRKEAWPYGPQRTVLSAETGRQAPGPPCQKAECLLPLGLQGTAETLGLRKAAGRECLQLGDWSPSRLTPRAHEHSVFII